VARRVLRARALHRLLDVLERADSRIGHIGPIQRADLPMPITLLDMIVLAVMLVSGLLAMVRGFMREILSIAAWGAAAIVTLYSFNKLLPTAKTYFNNDTVATIAVIAGVFIGTLIVVSIVTVRISDMILDSRIGALDRTLGFLFGLARGLLIVVVAFLFFNWLVPDKGQPDWVRSAKSKAVLEGSGAWLMSLLPDDPENTILKKLKKPKTDEEQTDAGPDAGTDGYGKSARDGLKQLIDGKATRR
jgi:membrane protein required for colicin V production